MWRELHGHNFPALSEKDEILAAKLRDICNSADNRQVAFVATTAGFGNQLYGALSTVLYGAVTGRRIRLHWGRFVDLQPFLQPYPDGCDWYTGAWHATGELFERVDDCAEQKSFDDFRWHQDPHPHVNKLLVHSNCLFISKLLQNKIHASSLAKLGIKPEQAFGQLFRAMIQPTASFAAKLEPILLRQFAGAWVVGVQLRVGMMHTEFESNEADDVRWKDDQQKYDAELSRREKQLWENYFQHAQTLMAGRTNSKLFLATDSKYVVALATQALGARLIYVPGELEMHGQLEPHQKGIWEKVFLDWWLMGECNDLIMMHWSTYGATAAMRTNLDPVTFCNGGFVRKKWSDVWQHNDVEACHESENRQASLVTKTPLKAP